MKANEVGGWISDTDDMMDDVMGGTDSMSDDEDIGGEGDGGVSECDDSERDDSESGDGDANASEDIEGALDGFDPVETVMCDHANLGGGGEGDEEPVTDEFEDENVTDDDGLSIVDDAHASASAPASVSVSVSISATAFASTLGSASTSVTATVAASSTSSSTASTSTSTPSTTSTRGALLASDLDTVWSSYVVPTLLVSGMSDVYI